MPPTRDAGFPVESKIISGLRKEFNVEEVFGTESFIGSHKSADNFQSGDVLENGPPTFLGIKSRLASHQSFWCTTANAIYVKDKMLGNNVAGQNNVGNDKCMTEDVKKSREGEKKKAKKLSAMEAKMENDNVEDYYTMDNVADEDELLEMSSMNRFELTADYPR
ncbi:hypothetical protein POM88_055098 [Heracleum sosnowskyi]|uniref:Uncharacterized protein n=1 Tax=Heracleum sosnowskyi TaxID=360622 RepID=A0AAD8GMH2_9APIA|nr:hypothetical protein POM88_055098 [Heracleum sosnowskyi]